jgi:uncharacterized membrane protein
MNKQELLNTLSEKLSGLPEAELKRSLDFYSEMIDDRIEDGLSEDEAVAAIGDVKTIADQIMEDIPLNKIVKDKVKKAKPKRALRAWEIVLIAVGSPIWFPVGLALFITVAVLCITFYLVYWVFILAFYVIDLCLALGFVAGILGAVLGFMNGQVDTGLFLIGCGFVCGGIAIPFFFLCNLIAKGMIALSKSIGRGIKWIFVGKKRGE